MNMPQWMTPPMPKATGKIRRHRSVMYDESDQQQYIRLKQEWLNVHPESTWEECQAAFRKIAVRCGI